MKTTKISTLILILSFWGCDQKKETDFTCNYYGLMSSTKSMESITSGTYDFSSNSEAIKVIDKIVSNVGLARNFEILESSDVDNATAVVFNEERYILYNNDFMEIANEITNNSWTSISILAHEIGHHLLGHTLSKKGSRPSIELEADKFSGFILAKMGASLQDAQSAVLNLVSEHGTSIHPKRSERLKAIASGYKGGSINKNKSNIQSKESNNTKKEDIVESLKTEPKPNNLIRTGKHSFTLQWISWDYPGSVTITRKDQNTYYIKGKQLSRENDDYIKIDGTLTPLSKKELVFNGSIKYLVSHNNNGQECVKSGKQIFKATGSRKYWRLQNMTNCEGGMLTDYIDIYFN
jgi:hypothetical protein